jgi:NTE family protein
MDITVALGGGGVRGFSHIGVLKVLEHKKLNIRGVAGSSIGALIGAAYCLGKSPDSIETYLKKVDQ